VDLSDRPEDGVWEEIPYSSMEKQVVVQVFI
jgi:hypothetical protein